MLGKANLSHICPAHILVLVKLRGNPIHKSFLSAQLIFSCGSVRWILGLVALTHYVPSHGATTALLQRCTACDLVRPVVGALALESLWMERFKGSGYLLRSIDELHVDWIQKVRLVRISDFDHSSETCERPEARAATCHASTL